MGLKKKEKEKEKEKKKKKRKLHQIKEIHKMMEKPR